MKYNWNSNASNWNSSMRRGTSTNIIENQEYCTILRLCEIKQAKAKKVTEQRKKTQSIKIKNTMETKTAVPKLFHE